MGAFKCNQIKIEAAIFLLDFNGPDVVFIGVSGFGYRAHVVEQISRQARRTIIYHGRKITYAVAGSEIVVGGIIKIRVLVKNIAIVRVNKHI
jgi:hypothetical protein